jgi:hypothetical protein
MPGMSGPAPKHSSIRARRNAPTANTMKLPGSGCVLEAPVWPLLPERSLQTAIIIAKSMIEQSELAVHDADAFSDHSAVDRAKRELRRANAQLDVAEHDKLVTEAEELKLWRKLWALPQACAWRRDGGYANEIAQYVRWKVLGELGDLKASKEARLLSNNIGLTSASLLKLRWEVEEDMQCSCTPPVAASPARRRRSTAGATGKRSTTPRKKPADPRSGLHLVE